MARQKLLTVKEVSARLGIAEQTTYKWARSGRLPGIKLGYLLRFDPDEIERMIERARKTA